MCKKAKYTLYVLNVKTITRLGVENAYLVLQEKSDLDIEIGDPQRRQLRSVSQ